MSPTTTTPSTSRRRASATGNSATGNSAIIPAATSRMNTPASSDSYKLPVVGTTLPSGLVEKGFWGALVGAAALGAVDPPLAALVAAGVVIARHRRA